MFLKNSFLFYLAVALLLSSCATIFYGVKSTIFIDSFPQDAVVKLNGVESGVTPVVIEIKKTVFKKTQVEIAKSGFITQNYLLKKKFNPASLFSQVFIPIDILTGAVITYPINYYNSRLVPNDTTQYTEYVFTQGADYHIWNKKEKLNWNLFNGETEDDVTDKFLKTGGVTCSWPAYLYSYNDSIINLYAFAIFDTKRSWVLSRTKTALNHEQRHFDITEIYSRKFKKKLLEADFSTQNTDTVIRTVYTFYKNKLSETQQRYDTETNHSINTAAQETWNVFIDKELKETATFEKPFIVIRKTKL